MRGSELMLVLSILFNSTQINSTELDSICSNINFILFHFYRQFFQNLHNFYLRYANEIEIFNFESLLF